ncbi:helix-turn-helix transcriptional regulator [Paenibacillus sp. Marseille-P2973]|uniref:helix-turn-helix transcriptional regulator n=1 Tax=Paenibacillus sp. Marseille-P2973 TaxID=1871032 RepID=UPI001B37BEFA|nr:helix-turn-helix transcriptional regulator [Paenibacillus sp. Marseille-P2973]MBQ4899318.1 helix-turn-helix transcriptional regulator [Paenibacillus sp. Marseille-P2973]
MAVGHFSGALEEVMKQNGDTLAKAGKAAHVDGSQIGKIIKGSRKASKPVIKAAAQHYDDGRLYIAAAGEVTDGASAPWLNNVDLHRSSVHLKVLEEIGEVEQALLQAPITKTKDQLGQKEMQQIKIAIMESIEAITALMHYVTVLCKEYSFSYFSAWREHRADLKAKKYMN